MVSREDVYLSVVAFIAVSHDLSLSIFIGIIAK